MKKTMIVLGISLSLLVLLTPVKNDNSHYAATTVTAADPVAHPILPPVG